MVLAYRDRNAVFSSLFPNNHYCFVIYDESFESRREFRCGIAHM